MKDYGREEIIKRVKGTLIKASSVFPPDKYACYASAQEKEDSRLAKWAMDAIIENADAARKDRSPLCDDTGIPHMVIELGKNRTFVGAS